MADEVLTAERIAEVLEVFRTRQPTESEWMAMSDSEKFQHTLSQLGAYIVVSPDVWEALKSQGKENELTRLSGRRVYVEREAPPGTLMAMAPPLVAEDFSGGDAGNGSSTVSHFPPHPSISASTSNTLIRSRSHTGRLAAILLK